jgi:pimeloyl-ACP methyl ester carboxylesterase
MTCIERHPPVCKSAGRQTSPDAAGSCRMRPFKLKDGYILAWAFGRHDGPVNVVFCHANGFNARTYRTILAPLGEAMRVRLICEDMAAQHSLQSSMGGHDWLDLRNDVVALLQSENMTNVVLSGHSLGASICLLTALAVPERVHSLVLFEPVLLSHDEPHRTPLEIEPLQLAKAALKRRRIFATRAPRRSPPTAARVPFGHGPTQCSPTMSRMVFRSGPTGPSNLHVRPIGRPRLSASRAASIRMRFCAGTGIP